MAKQISKRTHIPYATVAAWCYGHRATEVPADPAPADALADMYHKVLHILSQDTGHAHGRDSASNANVPAAPDSAPGNAPT